ncbi:MAG: amidohydrolase family protein [Candidatus Hydrogenedentes bacterium]|nr:amidohydrolase family protein [Candidatus Hydrogenedentota bacterium]
MSESMLLRGRLLGKTETVDVELRDGRIHGLRPAKNGTPDAGDGQSLFMPGLFDIQVNGAFGYDMQSSALTVDMVHGLNEQLLRHGVFRWVPTLVTDSAEALEHKCRVLGEALGDPALARHIPGIHLEGPHISPEDGPRGAHPAAHVCAPDLKLFERLHRASGGRILYVTLAPEWRGALAFIRAVTAKGVTVSLGHHKAEAEDIRAAADAGARLCTHLGNGLASLIHRHQNPLWPQLADDRLHVSLIADLEHLPVDLLKVLFRAKGIQRIILVSDSVLLAGMKPGKYQLFDAAVELKRSGRVCLSGTDLLAGSSLFLPEGVVNFSAAVEIPMAQAVAAASRVPARLLGVPLPLWPPRPGRRAEFSFYREAPKKDQAFPMPEFTLAGGIFRS